MLIYTQGITNNGCLLTYDKLLLVNFDVKEAKIGDKQSFFFDQ